jgi:hypothetical protein
VTAPRFASRRDMRSLTIRWPPTRTFRRKPLASYFLLGHGREPPSRTFGRKPLALYPLSMPSMRAAVAHCRGNRQAGNPRAPARTCQRLISPSKILWRFVEHVFKVG